MSRERKIESLLLDRSLSSIARVVGIFLIVKNEKTSIQEMAGDLGFTVDRVRYASIEIKDAGYLDRSWGGPEDTGSERLLRGLQQNLRGGRRRTHNEIGEQA